MKTLIQDLREMITTLDEDSIVSDLSFVESLKDLKDGIRNLNVGSSIACKTIDELTDTKCETIVERINKDNYRVTENLDKLSEQNDSSTYNNLSLEQVLLMIDYLGSDQITFLKNTNENNNEINKLNEELVKFIEETNMESAPKFTKIDGDALFDLKLNDPELYHKFYKILGINKETSMDELQTIRNSIVKFYRELADQYYAIPSADRTEEDVNAHELLVDKLQEFTGILDDSLIAGIPVNESLDEYSVKYLIKEKDGLYNLFDLHNQPLYMQDKKLNELLKDAI